MRGQDRALFLTHASNREAFGTNETQNSPIGNGLPPPERSPNGPKAGHSGERREFVETVTQGGTRSSCFALPWATL